MITENVRYLFKGIQVDERTREYIEKRIATLDKILEKVILTEVEIDLDKKGKFRVEIMIKTARDLFRAEDTTESIEGSTDLAVDELYEQITHKKEKLQTIKRRGSISLKKKAVIDEGARF